MTGTVTKSGCGVTGRNDQGTEYPPADRPLRRASANIAGEHFGEATAQALGSIFR